MTETRSARAVFRLLTARSPGAVAVVSVEGPGHRKAAERLLRRPDGRGFAWGAGPRRALLWLGDEAVDDVLVVDRGASVEICCHGSLAVIERLERHIGGWAPTDCQPAESLLRTARSSGQLALALEQRRLSWSEHIAWLAGLPPVERGRQVAATASRSRIAMALARPERVVLCGRTNAGKSTLLNRLLLEERALVGRRAGTTLDPVSEMTTLEGYPYDLVDTAGVGPSDSNLERAAQGLAAQEREAAIAVLVVDGHRGLSAEDRRLRERCRLTVRTKADLAAAPWLEDAAPDLTVSCVDPAAAPAVRTAVGEMLRRARGLPRAGPVGGVAALDPRQLRDLDALAPG